MKKKKARKDNVSKDSSTLGDWLEVIFDFDFGLGIIEFIMLLIKGG